jgi:hypothetical protein
VQPSMAPPLMALAGEAAGEVGAGIAHSMPPPSEPPVGAADGDVGAGIVDGGGDRKQSLAWRKRKGPGVGRVPRSCHTLTAMPRKHAKLIAAAQRVAEAQPAHQEALPQRRGRLRPPFAGRDPSRACRASRRPPFRNRKYFRTCCPSRAESGPLQTRQVIL